MTKQNGNASPHGSPLVIEIKKSSSGAVLSAVGVVSVTELSRESVSLASHSGRLSIKGAELVLSVFENKTVEVSGRIEGVEMLYAKHR